MASIIPSSSAHSSSAPSRVFIVPYRDRTTDKAQFLEKMNLILADTATYEIYFAHQCDYRPFNRGAMKNIGFLAIKSKYPADYKDITFIFHDVDTWPTSKDLIDYNTSAGVVKHYYGYKFALGGMFAIKGADFEKSKGFPNFWGWGIEDNMMNDRCLAVGLTIDRSCFYNIDDRRIARSFDGYKRIISKRDSLVYKHESPDDLLALKNVVWTFYSQGTSASASTASASASASGKMINITNFDCMMNPHEQLYQPIDIRNTKRLIVPKAYSFRRNWDMFVVKR